MHDPFLVSRFQSRGSMKLPESRQKTASPASLLRFPATRGQDLLARQLATGSISVIPIETPGSLLRHYEQQLLRTTPGSDTYDKYDCVPLAPPSPPSSLSKFKNSKIAKSHHEWRLLHENPTTSVRTTSGRTSKESTVTSLATTVSSPPSRSPSPVITARYRTPTARTPKSTTPPSPKRRATPYARVKTDVGQMKRSRLIYDCTLVSDKENVRETVVPQPDSYTIEELRGEGPTQDKFTDIIDDVANGAGDKRGSNCEIGRYDNFLDDDAPQYVDRTEPELEEEEDDLLGALDDVDEGGSGDTGMTREEEEAFRMVETTDPHLIGLPNPASRCWLNASLQCLMPLQPLVQELKSAAARNKGHLPTSKILRTFLHLVLQRAQGHVYRVQSIVTEFHQSLRAIDSEFSSNRQQDVSEFIVRFSDYLREEFARLGNPAAESALRERQLNGNTEANGASTADVPNPILDNLTVTVARKLICEGCNSVTPDEEKSQTIEVSPSNSRTMQQAVNKSMKSETLDRNCACGTTHCVTTSVIQQLPRFLIVHVNRYQLDPVSKTTNKLNSLLDIPEWLTLEHIIAPDARQPPPWLPADDIPDDNMNFSEHFSDTSLVRDPVDELDDDTRKAIELSLEAERANRRPPPHVESTPTKESPTKDAPCDGSSTNCYHLSAVISHLGNQTSKGHYTADVFSYTKNAWFNYNDQNVREITFTDVTDDDRGANGYLFFYTHKTVFHQLCSLAAVKS